MLSRLLKQMRRLLVVFTVFSTAAYADTAFYNQHPWSLMYYYGQTVSNPLITIFYGEYKHWPEHIQSAELNYTLNENNAFRRFFSPVVSVVQVNANLTQRKGDHENTIYEFDPYFNIRWVNLPWNHYVDTSFAIGEGISYASSYPYIEKRNNDNAKRLLNYLMFEATFAAPSHPEWQVLARIHHRSGAFGLYHAGNSGSNDVGLGIRYFFD